MEVREVLGDGGMDGNAHSVHTNGDSQSVDQYHGEALGRSSSSAHRGSIRRKTSSSSVGPKGATLNGDTSRTSLTTKRPTRTSSRASNHVNGHGLARKLSHRSITSSQTRSSPGPFTPTSEGPRDPNAKRPQAPVPMLKIGDETPTSSSEPLVDEVASCLREWHSKNLHELLLNRRYSILEKVSELVNRLNLARRQLLHGVLTAQELMTLREEIVWDLVGGNKMLSKEVIVRDPKQHGRLLTGDDSSIELTKLQSTMSLLDRAPVFQHDPVNLYHLMLDVKAFVNNDLIAPTLTIYLCSRCLGETSKAITESFVVELPTQEEFEQSASLGRFRTLFTDLTMNDVGDASRTGQDIYVVIRVQANRPIQRAAVNGSLKPNHADENGSISRPTTSSYSSTNPAKGGRQSMMWAQKLGSVRNRAQHDNNASQTQSNTGSGSSTMNGSRPTTQDSNRPTTQRGTQYVKRNVGVGLLNIKHLFGLDTPGDHCISIWTPVPSSGENQTSQEDWDELIRDLVNSRSGAFAKSKSIDQVRLGLQSFASPDSNDLILRTPTLLQNIMSTPKIEFPGAPTKARSDIYVMLSEAVLPRQALLSHPQRGTVQISSSLELKSIQLTLEVRKKTGERIERCIFPGSNSPGQTAWRTSAVERGETWNQMIKLVIPTADVPEAHLIMSIADAPGFPFALSWIPLWTDGAFIRNGAHAPLLYLYDKVTSSSDNGRGAYLAFPWDSKGRYGDTKDETVTGPIATLRLQTELCSTYFSQDTILLGILRWKEQRGDQIQDLLKRFAFVPEIEIVKLVSDVLDALFGILVENAGKDEFEDAVFNALVTVLGIVHDRRFKLGPFVDGYAESRFDHPFATPCLIRSYLRLLSNPADPNKSRRVRATFKVGREVLKFVVCARKRQELKEAGIGANTQMTFKRDLRMIFHAFQALMRDASPILVGSKTLVVQHMQTWLPELRPVLAEEEIFDIAISFLESCSNVQGKLILYKLVLVLNLTDKDFFSQKEIREKISTHTSKWIEPYWGSKSESTQWREQVRLCCSIASKQARGSHVEDFGYMAKAIQSYLSLIAPSERKTDTLSLLFPATYPFPSKSLHSPADFDEALIELAGLLATLSGTPFGKHIDISSPEVTDLLFDGLEVIISILSGAAFPKTWLSLYVFHHRSSLRTLEALFDSMVSGCVPSPEDADDFDTELWSKFFLALLTLVRGDVLALETFPEQKRRAVWKIAGDVREQGATLLKRSWEAIGWEANLEEQTRYGVSRLGGFQVQYVPSLVAPIVELCLSVHEGLRNVAVRILQAMIVSEWTLNEDLSVIQAEMVDCLEMLFQSKSMGESLVQKMFVNELLDLFEALARTPLDPMWQAIKDMITTIDELLELLAAVHSPDITEALRILNTLQLMNFLKDMQKEDIFIRYVHQLADVQAKLNNKTEAGLALRLHADLYTWDATPVRALSDPNYPEQSSFERKEQLYFEMMNYLEEGEAWDSALAYYRELAREYEYTHYDFAKLARTQRSMAKIYENVAKGDWQSPRFFRVTYHGMGFPSSLRGKEFIYEGEPAERQSAFTDRMRLLHPAAQISSKGDVIELEGQYLQITPVSPYRDLEHPIYQQSKVVQSTRDFVTLSSPNRFAVTTKRHSPSSGVHHQWIEKTLYSTKESFPTILRRSEIMAVDVIRLSPLQTAVERTARKTSELAALNRRIGNGDEAAFPSLTDTMMSSVDPASTASVAQYRQLLPSMPEINNDEDNEPVLSPLQNALHITLLEHVSMLKHCLVHYARPDHVHSRAFLNDNLNETFAPEMAYLAPSTVPAAEPSSFLYSSSRSFAGVTTSTTPALTVVNGNPPSSPQEPPQGDPEPLSHLSLSFLKTAPQGPNMVNGTTSHPSAVSDDGSSSVNLSQGRNNSTHNSTTAGTTAHHGESEGSERPTTAQSGRSGKLKKRLSSLGIKRVASARDKPKTDAMGGVAEE